LLVKFLTQREGNIFMKERWSWKWSQLEALWRQGCLLGRAVQKKDYSHVFLKVGGDAENGLLGEIMVL
jgi:hypothetical protein